MKSNQEKKGATLIEYGLMTSLLLIATVLTLRLFGVVLHDKFECVEGFATGEGECNVALVNDDPDDEVDDYGYY